MRRFRRLSFSDLVAARNCSNERIQSLKELITEKTSEYRKDDILKNVADYSLIVMMMNIEINSRLEKLAYDIYRGNL